MASFVIVGAGECGARAAFALRDKGFAGGISLVGAEPHLPYERPPLSKETILEGAGPRLVANPFQYDNQKITVRSGVSAIAIDRATRRVILSDNSEVAYDKLLIATGSRPRTLPGLVNPGPRVLSLRNHGDALAIRAHLAAGRHLAIAGAGFIGLEMAAAARCLGAAVTVINAGQRVLSRGVPAEIAGIIAARHRAEGVRILCNVQIDAVVETPDSVSVALADGQIVVADLLLVGIGAVPNTELAERAGLLVDNGIAVDETLRTADSNIFAAGDCISYPIPLYGRRVRLESWRSAQDQGRHAAGSMLGRNEAMAAVPWFWSEQYNLVLQVAGLSDGAAVRVRRDLGDEAFILFDLAVDGRLIAASGVGTGNAVARDIRVAEMMIAARAHPNPDELASANVKLKALLLAA